MEIFNSYPYLIKSDKSFGPFKKSHRLFTCLFLLLMHVASEKSNSVFGLKHPEVKLVEVEEAEFGNNHSHMDNSFNEEFESEGFYQMMPMYGYVFSAVMLFTIWIIGTAGNFMVPYLVATTRQLQTPMNLFLVNLSICDFTMAAFGSPISLTAAVLGGWPFGNTGCVIYGFGMALGGITSITTLMVLAFERFLMIARPFRAADIQNQHSIMFIFAIWIYSLVLTVPPLIGWASYGPEAAHISCSVNWETNDIGTTSYIIFLFTMGLVLPLTTIIFSYMGILITIRQTGQNQSTTSATRRAELRVVGMVATMVSSFMIAWSPYAILSLIVAFSPAHRKQITPFIAVLPSIFAKSSSCYNPIIYVGLNTQFRAAWLKFLGIQRPRDEDPGTAMTLSVTAAVPKDSNYSKKDKTNEEEAESTFICKNHHDTKSNNETQPLLLENSPLEVEKFLEVHTPIPHSSPNQNISQVESEAKDSAITSNSMKT